jgi:hypothetical protein
MECFICTPEPLQLDQEQPPQWLLPRRACAYCTSQARLANGELLNQFLGQAETLEGSGLNYLLNPVTIEGHRGWSDFVAGWYVVQEEIFPSENYFEFYTQHTPSGIAFLHVVYQYLGSMAGEPSAADLLTCFQYGGEANTFDRLERIWLTNQLISAWLCEQRITGLPTPAEIEALWQDMPPVTPSAAPAAIQVALQRLVVLARQRFTHLDS